MNKKRILNLAPSLPRFADISFVSILELHFQKMVRVNSALYLQDITIYDNLFTYFIIFLYIIHQFYYYGCIFSLVIFAM
jgi:hypothetical protein